MIASQADWPGSPTVGNLIIQNNVMLTDQKQDVRAFIAYMLPLETSATVHKKLRSHTDDGSSLLRWTPPQQYHLTLRFLGFSQPEQLRQLSQNLRAALSGFERFICMTGGVEYLPSSNRPRVMTMKIHSGRRLDALHRICEEQALKAGFSSQPRSYRPHVTLARYGKGSFADAGTRLPGYRLNVGELALMESHRQSGSVRYEVLERFNLND